MACDAQSLIDTAYNAGYAALSERDLMECIVASACAGGSGGGTNGGTGVPTSTPSTPYALYIQTDSVPAGLIWEYYSGAWH